MDSPMTLPHRGPDRGPWYLAFCVLSRTKRDFSLVSHLARSMLIRKKPHTHTHATFASNPAFF